jgi:hypothetical protein
MPRFVTLPQGERAAREIQEKLAAVRHARVLKIGKGLRRAQMGAREAVVPRKFVFVPHRPEEAQEKSSCGKDVARAAQKHLPGRGRLAGKADDL